MDPFIGEIKIFGFNFVPYNWAMCDGQLLPIAQYTSLFSIISTIYGGNGTNNFAVPNLMGKFPIHSGTGPGLTPKSLGESSGYSEITLTESQIPQHNHTIKTGYDKSDSNTPSSNSFMGQSVGTNAYIVPNEPNFTTMSFSTISNTGNNVAHNNMQPYLPLLFCIALDGYYPPRT